MLHKSASLPTQCERGEWGSGCRVSLTVVLLGWDRRQFQAPFLSHTHLTPTLPSLGVLIFRSAIMLSGRFTDKEYLGERGRTAEAKRGKEYLIKQAGLGLVSKREVVRCSAFSLQLSLIPPLPQLLGLASLGQSNGFRSPSDSFSSNIFKMLPSPHLRITWKHFFFFFFGKIPLQSMTVESPPPATLSFPRFPF